MYSTQKSGESGEKPDPFAILARYFANRQRDPRNKVTKVANLRRDLEKTGCDISHDDLASVFEKFESLEAGSFKRGRPRAQKDRFEWAVSAREFAEKLVDAEGDALSPVAPSKSTTNCILDHKYRLRPDFEVELALPADMTRNEAIRLAESIKTLPFEGTGENIQQS